MDVFEIDAASNRGIDEIKNLRDQLAFAPVNCRYKVFIIDEVHMLSTEGETEVFLQTADLKAIKKVSATL